MTRRQLIEKELEPARCLDVADAYLEEGRTTEAIVFLQKAGADDRLAELAEQAVAEGDTFLLKSIVDATQQDVAAERWRALSQAAERSGRDRYAQTALRYARSSEE